MKKRVLAIILTGIMATSLLTGCGKSSGGGSEAAASADSASAPESAAAVETGSSEIQPTDASSDAIEKKIFRIGIECTYAPRIIK